jgi:kynurenine formamidase
MVFLCGMTRLVDLSHAVRHGLVTYPGLPAPVIGEYLSRSDSRARYAPGTEFQIGRIELVANTGTYVDAPFHRFAAGADIAHLALESLADLPGLLVRVPEGPGRAIGPEHFQSFALAGRAVLVHTGFHVHFGTPAYGSGHPFLTAAAAEHLVRERAALVGIDSLNVDDTADGERPVHTRLLAAGIPICEHLTNLDALPAVGFRFHAAPVKVEGLGSFPVRAYAVVE